MKPDDELSNWYDKVYKPYLDRFPERKEAMETSDGEPIAPIYTPDETTANYLEDQGFPGAFPFTRGVYPTMYRGKLWTMRQYAGFGDATESNQRYKYLINQGVTGLSVAFDLPTQLGLDSDDLRCEGEVGRVGVAIDTLADMEVLFDGISLDQVSTSMTINATALELLMMYICVAEKQNIPLSKLSGTTQNDMLKEFIARGNYIYPPQASLRIALDLIAYCSQHLPKWNPISISGYHIREAGSDAAQEVAFTLANGIAYVEAALERGLDVDDFAGRLSFFFNAHNNLFEEVAKFRVARKLWARIMKERFHAKNEQSLLLRFHTQTAGSTLTAQQPMNNVIRVTIQALAAVLGGTQSLHTNSMDEALALPSELAVKTALRTQQLIAYESGVTDTIDPLAGSYFLQALENNLEEKILGHWDKIEELGGALAAVESGYYQEEIHKAAYRYQQAIERQDKVIIGVNRFVEESNQAIQQLRMNPDIEVRQIKSLQSVRANRDNTKVKQALIELEDNAKGETNLAEAIHNAVKVYASIGEISTSLKKVFGQHQET